MESDCNVKKKKAATEREERREKRKERKEREKREERRKIVSIFLSIRGER